MAAPVPALTRPADNDAQLMRRPVPLKSRVELLRKGSAHSAVAAAARQHTTHTFGQHAELFHNSGNYVGGGEIKIYNLKPKTRLVQGAGTSRNI